VKQQLQPPPLPAPLAPQPNTPTKKK